MQDEDVKAFVRVFRVVRGEKSESFIASFAQLRFLLFFTQGTLRAAKIINTSDKE